MTLTPGTRLEGYEVISSLGSGGMGEVYRARDAKLNRDVAIKVLPGAFAADTERLRRFEQEARTLAALSHPNILTIHDLGIHQGEPFLVMELLEGETLRERLGGKALPTRKAAEIALQMAHGLAAAHEKGIVHRDLKPENLFLCKDGRVKILDFGLAKLHASAIAPLAETQSFGSEPGTVVGTSGYMSPEQVEGGILDARSDLFNLGVVLWEMLSGKAPFHRSSAIETMHAILKEEPPELDPALKVPPALERILDSCLAKVPEGRFHSAHDLAFALEGMSGASTSGGRAVVPGTRAWNWKAPAWGLLGAAVVMCGLALASSQHWPPFMEVHPTFQRLTFRRGNLTTARFAADSKSIVYDASWDGREQEIYLAVPQSPESRPLGLGRSQLLSVSSRGELAILLGREGFQQGAVENTLARIPVLGGTPRELLEDVSLADWSPDGTELAVLHRVGEQFRLEYPIGTVWCELASRPNYLRVSPSGREIAYLYRNPPEPSIHILDRKGHTRTLSLGPGYMYGLAWSPDGRKLITSWGPNICELAVWEIPLHGPPRVLLRGPKSYYFNDVDAAGRLLVEQSSWRQEALLQVGSEPPRDITWMDGCDVMDLAPDGETVLFADSGEAGGYRGSVWLRKPGAQDPVRLGEGLPLAGFSPDGKWVPVQVPGRRAELLLLPTGAGQPRVFSFGEVHPSGALWCPNGRRLLVAALDSVRVQSAWTLDLEKGTRTRFEGLDGVASSAGFSPDGQTIAFQRRDGTLALQPAEGGPARVLSFKLGSREVAYGWSPEGGGLYVADPNRIPGRIDRVDLQTGQRTLWREMNLKPTEAVGLGGLAIASGGRAWAYSYRRVLTSDLYLVEGLR
jgi:predicted Ser/Thr protein kinase